MTVRKKKNQTIDYRPAIEEEIPDIARLFWKHLKAAPSCISHGEMQIGVATDRLTLATDGKEKWMRHITAMMDEKDCRIFVAYSEDGIVGFSIVRIADDGGAPFGVLNNLLVRADYRRHGIGRALLTKSLEWLRRWRVSGCYLESGRMNHSAHNFLDRCGFAPVSHTYHHCLTSKPR